MKPEIINTVKTLLSINDDAQDTLISIYADMAYQSICNYCNISELPEQLLYVAANMVIQLIKDNTSAPIDTGADLPVSSISEGGRTVTFATGAAAAAAQSKADALVGTIAQLKQYRQLYR